MARKGGARRGWMRPVAALCVAVAAALFPAPLPAQDEPPEATDRVLVAGVNRDYPPFEYADGAGSPAGYSVEILQAAAAAAGLRVELRAGEWAGIRSDLEAGRIDIAAGMLYSPERAKIVDFSESHLRIGYSMFVRDGERTPQVLDDLRGAEVLVEAGSLMHDFLAARGDDFRIAPVPSEPDALRLLASGSYDAALVPTILGRMLVRDGAVAGVSTSGPPVFMTRMCFAVPAGRGDLVGRLNAGLGSLRSDGRYEEIRDRWFGDLDGPVTAPSWTLRHLPWILGAVALACGLALTWVALLRREVARRTEALRREELARSAVELDLKAILDNSPTLLYATDLEGRFLFVNSEFAQVHLAGDTNPRGRTRTEGMGAERAALHDAADRRVLETAVPLVEEETFREGGEDRVHLFLRFPLHDDSGKPRGVCGIATDVTASRRSARAMEAIEEERRRLADLLVRSQRMEGLGRLAGGVAHDFNNILTAVLGHAAMARSPSVDEEERRGHLRGIEQAAERAADLVRRLLAFSSRHATHPRLVDPRRLLARLEPMLRRLIPENVRLEILPGEGPVTVKADPAHLEVVLVNLVVNAREAMPGGGRVRISVERRGRAGTPVAETVALAVDDEGPGVDPDLRERIFEPFFTTKRRPGGLGLATCYGFIAQEKGTIRCVDSPLGGARFEVELPRAEGEPEPDPERESGAEGPAGEPLPAGRGTILVAEDQEVVRRLAVTILKGAGYRVLAAPGGEEALRAAADAPGVDLLFTDVVMPGLQGPELAERLRALRPGLPVLFASGFTTDLRMGGDHLPAGSEFLAKPYSPSALLSAVQRLLAAPTEGTEAKIREPAGPTPDHSSRGLPTNP